MRKRPSKAGETLTETLCAVLVTGLAVALLAAMISAASRLDRKTAQNAAELYGSVSKAEDPMSESLGSGTVTVEIEGGSRDLAVQFFGDQDQAVSYRAAEPEAGTP